MTGATNGQISDASAPFDQGIGVLTITGSNGSLTISPNAGDVIASINLAHANVWTGAQSFTTANVSITDVNIVLGTTTGTKIGTATSQKLALWNATPIVQPTTGIAAASFTANTSGTLNDTATWGGYTIGQVVQALKNIGALA